MNKPTQRGRGDTSVFESIEVNQRQYRGKQSRPIPVWNGLIEHRARIGVAIWEFIWLLDSITEERNGVGIVLGGAPVRASRIARDLAFDERTVRGHLENLEDGHYIKRRRTAYGCVIEVCKSRKFGIWRSHKRSEDNTQSEHERSEEIPSQIGRKGPIRSDEKRTNKEDAAVTQQKDAASVHSPAANPNPKDSVWAFLEILPCGPISFRTVLEDRWARKNGRPHSVVIGETIDAWETAEGHKPPHASQLFRALAKLRQQERQGIQGPGESGGSIHIIEPEEIPA